MRTIYLILLLALPVVQEATGQASPPPPPAKESARPPAKEADRAKTRLWNLSFQLDEHDDLEKVERAAAVEVGYAFFTVANHLSIYLHLVDAAEIGEGNGVAREKFDGPLKKAAIEIARATSHQSDKCSYWIKAAKDETLREQILEGQEAMNEIASLLEAYFRGEALDHEEAQQAEEDGTDPPANASESERRPE